MYEKKSTCIWAFLIKVVKKCPKILFFWKCAYRLWKNGINMNVTSITVFAKKGGDDFDAVCL